MSKKQLWILYGSIVFMLLFGFSFINIGLLQHDFKTATKLSPFDITGLFYILATLIGVRMIMVKCYPARKMILMCVLLILMMPAFILFRYLLEEIISPALINESNYVDDITFGYYIADNFSYALYYIIIGILLYMLDRNIYNNKMVKFLEAQKREAELNYLQIQFNPHFLFNSLNNIYALVEEKSDHAGKAVMRLSDIARYLIYEKENLCLLQEELEQAYNYIDLQKLRFDYVLPIDICLQGDYNKILIPPFTLVTFIENAFKHGDFKDPEKPLKIFVQATDQQLRIVVSNKIGDFYKDKTSGVGLNNIKKRLEIIYPKKHLLKYTEINNIFTIELTLQC